MARIHGPGRLSWLIAPWIVSVLALLIHHLAQPPETLRPKIFVLGLSKTGTTSIGDALERLGYRRLGWRDIRSRHLVHSWANGEHDALRGITRWYDAFEDLPWPLMYQEMAELYPDAKFVLSLRKDEETWLRSMSIHVGRGRWQPYTYFYGADTFLGNEEIMRESYRNHSQNVRSYFADKKDRFMEMSIDDGDVNWDVLCQIAMCPGGKAPALSFPRANTAASWNMGWFLDKWQFCWGWLVTRTEEQASHFYYERKDPAIRFVLSAFWRLYDVIERAYTELYFRSLSHIVLPPVTTNGPLKDSYFSES
ncbi:uncharacterized protein MYCFIDRAFT_209652 [Pseudocercospora fijiensis CIRAD86]|uniref:NAD dependent epimerase/dehydratase n=1 Tax=Pseudocercospora fijiensis (strain CIRAD86) TaxID=383855 RepID=N1QAG6_PSEFD|nr:uncharacterized protein MYCFIDRAFT_209652 [Pseudocercospora fijiensis CIRAD86]EME87932.1 hypothetical protein MYCFIDRAFT_209652 [Pseudocercospora fijiensis CIRAD86]